MIINERVNFTIKTLSLDLFIYFKIQIILKKSFI